MSDALSPDYTLRELRSYLPGGWNLVDEAEPGSWDEKKSLWRTAVRDTTDLEWELRVSSDEIREQGRLEALREAAHRLHQRDQIRFKFLGG